MNHAIAIEAKKKWAKPLHLTELDVLFSVLPAFQLCQRFSNIKMIGVWLQCHSHTSMIRHQIWPLWANLYCRWTSSISPERKFSNFEVIFAAARFMPRTSIKIAWHKPSDIPTSSATSLIVIRRLSKIIFFTASMFSSVVDVLGRSGRPSSLASSRRSLNRLYHNRTCVLLM